MGSLTMIQTLYRYGTWATGRIFEEAAHLTAAELTQVAPGGDASVRETLVHLVWGEDLWLARMRDAPSPAHPDPGGFPDLAAVRSWWEEVDSAMVRFVNQLTFYDLDCYVSYVNSLDETWEYQIWQMLLHQANHATQHRSELAMMLSAYGHSPGWLDLMIFIDLENEENDYS
jgi:uncharacterized damage-inducible protein DinB